MPTFLEAHADKIHGTLSCFDRVLFRGYLPVESGAFLATYLHEHGVRRETLKSFLLEQADRIKRHAESVAKKAERPYRYLAGAVRKEDLARQMAEESGIAEGLVCVFSILEPCKTFSLVWKQGHTFIHPARRKCLFLYYYFMDRELGLIHVKVQTWFPLRIQIYVNAHEWLARALARSGIRYLKYDNAFVRIDDMPRAQAIADQFSTLPWVRTLHGYARRVNPLIDELLQPMQYYWSTAQAEYSTDVLFKNRRDLQELMPRLLEQSLVSFNASDIMSFLGRKLFGQFKGDIVTDLREQELKRRLPGRRVKHRVKGNWIKMYDKGGSILRVEMVINHPDEFRVRRRVRRNGKRVTCWVPMRKGVAWLFRYRDVSLKANMRYLDALAHVSGPAPALRQLDAVVTRRTAESGRTAKPFNPLSKADHDLFRALLDGDHLIHGFNNRDLRSKLRSLGALQPGTERTQSARVSRLLARLHAYGLIAKVPRSRRWRVSLTGRRVMSATIVLRDRHFPDVHREVVEAAA